MPSEAALPPAPGPGAQPPAPRILVGGLNLAGLTLRDALDVAILIEEDARRRYAEFVDELETHHAPEAADFFRTMARSETKHRDWLRRRRQELFGDEPSRIDSTQMPEIEAPPREDMDIFMSRRQAFAVALRAEERAYRFFADALVHMRNPEARALFESLRDEEAEHRALVQAYLDHLGPRG